MTNLSLQDRFSLISLNALNSTRNSTAKKAAIRCISAAGVLDRFLQETEELTEDSDEYRSRLDALSVSLKEAAHLSSSAAKELEHTVYTRLNNLGLMTEASSLVSCDLEFSSAGNKILEYRTDSDNSVGIHPWHIGRSGGEHSGAEGAVASRVCGLEELSLIHI